MAPVTMSLLETRAVMYDLLLLFLFLLGFSLHLQPFISSARMLTMTWKQVFNSPGDPMFWLHHGMVDRTYWIWQNQKPMREPSISMALAQC